MPTAATGTPQGAGVRFPPPLVYLLGLIAAYLVNRVIPRWILRPEPRWMWLVGVLVTLAGFVIAQSGVFTFRRHGTTLVPFKPATVIVTSGPYAITRNPMYTGLLIAYAGAGLLIDTWWAFVFLPVVWFVIDRAIIEREERYLASAFGAEYEAYRAKTPRWFW